MPEIRTTTSTVEQTRALGARIGELLRPGDVVLLAGDLGAGKTSLVQGAASSLGVAARVQSPSFVLVRRYEGRSPVVHVDVYRLDSFGELEDLGYDELFSSEQVTFVEWGDVVAEALPVDRLEVTIERTEGDDRLITLRPSGSWVSRLERVDLEVVTG